MSILYEERASDSPYVDTIARGRTLSAGTPIRPAESHWHLVCVTYQGHKQILAVGPLTTSGVATYIEGAEILWIKFKLGAFFPHLPTKNFLDSETPLPAAASQSFWLKSSAWQYPDFENADTFIERLVREEILVQDNLIQSVLQHPVQAIPRRTVRHHFARATGLSLSLIQQLERARHAEALLQNKTPIIDTVFAAGYYDQAHMTRALKRFIGYTPAQIVQMSEAGTTNQVAVQKAA